MLLLPCSEILSHNYSNLKDESVLFLTRGDKNENIAGGGTYTVLWVYGWTLMRDSCPYNSYTGIPKAFVGIQPLFYNMRRC